MNNWLACHLHNPHPGVQHTPLSLNATSQGDYHNSLSFRCFHFLDSHSWVHQRVWRCIIFIIFIKQINLVHKLKVILLMVKHQNLWNSIKIFFTNFFPHNNTCIDNSFKWSIVVLCTNTNHNICIIVFNIFLNKRNGYFNNLIHLSQP